jgi:hypothetical protein
MPDQVISEGTIREGRLLFSFSSAYQVIKFDNTPVYKRLQECVDQTRGIDFLGIQNQKYLLMMEVKDYAGEGRGSKKSYDKLIQEVAQKVRDSCASIVHGSRMAAHDAKFWEEVGRLLFQNNQKVQVILWIELSKQKRKRGTLITLRQKLKQKLNWINPRVTATSTETQNPIPDLTVSLDTSSSS